jgi:hypothetical protein
MVRRDVDEPAATGAAEPSDTGDADTAGLGHADTVTPDRAAPVATSTVSLGERSGGSARGSGWRP